MSDYNEVYNIQGRMKYVKKCYCHPSGCPCKDNYIYTNEDNTTKSNRVKNNDFPFREATNHVADIGLSIVSPEVMMVKNFSSMFD